MTSHSRSYGEELQRSIFVQIASAIGDLESAIGIKWPPRTIKSGCVRRVMFMCVLNITVTAVAIRQNKATCIQGDAQQVVMFVEGMF